MCFFLALGFKIDLIVWKYGQRTDKLFLGVGLK